MITSEETHCRQCIAGRRFVDVSGKMHKYYRNEYRNADQLFTFHSFMITAKCKLEKDKEKVSTSELVEFSN